MAIAVYFQPNGLTLKQYNEVHRLLQESGNGNPSGRIHHSGFGEDGSLMVYEIWDSPEAFQAFGAVLMPLLAQAGVDAGEPEVMPMHMVQQVARDS